MAPLAVLGASRQSLPIFDWTKRRLSKTGAGAETGSTLVVVLLRGLTVGGLNAAALTAAAAEIKKTMAELANIIFVSS